VLHFRAFVASTPATKRRRWIVMVYFVWAAAWLAIGAYNWNGPGLFGRTPFPFGLGLILVCIGVGIEFTREGARLTSGIVGGLLAASGVWFESLLVITNRWDPWMILALAIWAVVWPIPWLVVSAYSFLPSTRAHFADVRKAKAGAIAQR
jgi:hypothetical protein